MLVGFCIFIMTIITVFQIIVGGNWVGYTSSQSYSNSVTVNGSTSSFDIQGQDLVFGVDSLTGFIAILVVIIAIASVLGLQILGSGLNDQTVRILTYVIVYGGIWGVLSVLSYPLIASIELFGGIIYILLTLAYVVGVVQNLISGG